MSCCACNVFWVKSSSDCCRPFLFPFRSGREPQMHQNVPREGPCWLRLPHRKGREAEGVKGSCGACAHLSGERWRTPPGPTNQTSHKDFTIWSKGKVIYPITATYLHVLICRIVDNTRRHCQIGV